MLSYALIAGISISEAMKMSLGMIMDMFIYRKRYDFILHRLKEAE